VRQALRSHTGMPSSGTSPVLSYSTLQTLGLGVGSSSTPLQGHMGGTPTPFNAFPYGGGHIPPSSPSLGGSHQQSTGKPTYHSLFGAGSQGPPLHNMLVGSTPFSLAETFGNNAFSSVAFPTGGNPSFGQSTPMQGTIPAQGENLGTSSTSRPWNSWQGSIPSSECRSGVILSTINGTPDKLLCLSPRDQHGATLPRVLRI
jgi:hypothetical protein